MHCQSCGLPLAPTIQVCPRCGRPNVPASQPGLDVSQRGGSPSTEQFSWQPGNTVFTQQPSSNQNGLYQQSPANPQPSQWNTMRQASGMPPAPFNAGQAPMTHAPQQMQAGSGTTNIPASPPQGGYPSLPYTTSGFAQPQMGSNQPLQQSGQAGQPIQPDQSGHLQRPGQAQMQGYAQTMAPAQSGPIHPQAFPGGPFPPTTTQSSPIHPQAFGGGAPSSAPLQSSPIHPQAFGSGTFSSSPLQSSPMQSASGTQFPAPPLQSGPALPQALNSGAFPFATMQTGPGQPPAFHSGPFPYAEGNRPAAFQAATGQIQQKSSAGVLRSASVIQPIRTSPTRKILIGVGSGLIIVLLIAVGYLAFLQKPSTPQITTTTQPILQTHPKKLPPLPPITASDPQALYTQATSREAISSDPLRTQSDNDWETVNSPGTCSFDGNTLHALNSTADERTTMCIANATKYKNIAFQAQLTAIKGDTYGLIVRADSKGRQLYLFSVTTTGMYTLAVTDGQNGTLAHVIAGGTSPAIKKGLNQSNQATIIARDNTLYLYVNQKFLTKVSDTTATIGSVGLFVGNSQGDVSEARFTNARMWSV